MFVLAFYREYLGRTKEVLFEERKNDGTFTGFTDNYIKVAVKTDDDLSNKILPVKLESLNGKVVNGKIL